MSDGQPVTRAVTAARALGLDVVVTSHGPGRSLAEAADLRGIEPRDIVKTMVVRRAADDYLFVLVPGDSEIAWPKLRALLGVSRLSMPDAATALDVTGYERGTITPFGARTAWPVPAAWRTALAKYSCPPRPISTAWRPEAMFSALAAAPARASVGVRAKV